MDISKLLVNNAEVITTTQTKTTTNTNHKKRHACTWIDCNKTFSTYHDDDSSDLHCIHTLTKNYN